MIRFLVDASSDYNIEEAKDKNVEVIPIAVTMGEETFYDGVNITRDEFYEKVQSSSEFPKTAQPSPQKFIEAFEQAKKQGDQLICILLSSALSGTVQSATLAKNIVEYDDIYIIDSLTATFAIKIMADYGIQLAKDGKNATEIVQAIEEIKSKVKVYAVLDTLENLYRGGRLSKLEAGIGNVAKIKPLITITEEGKIGVKGKSIGKKKALNDMIKLLSGKEIRKDFPVYTLYSFGTENSDAFIERLNELEICCTDRFQIGPTIGTHIGPGAYGILFVEQ